MSLKLKAYDINGKIYSYFILLGSFDFIFTFYIGAPKKVAKISNMAAAY